METTYPLVLVFYLDRDLMKNKQLVQTFADSINSIIEYKKFNALAFFLPTDGEERVECINPLIAPKEDMDKIQKLITDISNEFQIGVNDGLGDEQNN